jgi:thiol-disulfide isomerase/thioredoxin
MLLSFLLFTLLAPQAKAPADQEKGPSKEDQDLERSLGEAGNSPVEYARAIERHLRKYPMSDRREEMARVLTQASIEMRDKRRILLYGVPTLEAGSRSPQILDHVTRALIDRDDKESNERALKYSRQLIEILNDQRKSQLEAKELTPSRGRRLDETEYAIARAHTFESRALGNLGRFDEAAAASLAGWAVCPTSENARERAKWLEKANKPKEALAAYAEALALNDERTGSADVTKDRARLAELARKANGSETSFGEALLSAYDRVAAATTAREQRLRAFDPNTNAKAMLDFTISGIQGDTLAMSSLKGKVVVIDFWATWCGPCRAQHPLYEQAKLRFKNNKDVVFLAISTDEDRNVVKPFLEANKWSKQVYYEDGLANLLRISSIPTTVILDKQGNIISRLNGFIAERFVDMIADRVKDALVD